MYPKAAMKVSQITADCINIHLELLHIKYRFQRQPINKVYSDARASSGSTEWS